MQVSNVIPPTPVHSSPKPYGKTRVVASQDG